jgi:hypothetical protein
MELACVMIGEPDMIGKLAGRAVNLSMHAIQKGKNFYVFQGDRINIYVSAMPLQPINRVIRSPA